MKLRSKLLALSLLTLLLPWSAWKLLQELERFLRENQESTLLSTAETLSGALPLEFQSQLLFLPEHTLPLRDFDRPPVNDGYSDEWPESGDSLLLESADGQLSVQLLAGISGGLVYLFMDVGDATPVRAEPGLATRDSDAVRLSLRTARGMQSWTIMTSAPGPLRIRATGPERSELEGYWLDTSADPAQGTREGYRLELALPVVIQPGQPGIEMSIEVIDVESVGSGIARQAVTGYGGASPGWISLTPRWQELSDWLAHAAPGNARALLVDTGGWVLADSGGSSTSAAQTTWLQRLLYRVVSDDRPPIVEPLPESPVRLSMDPVASALDGAPASEWAQELDDAVVHNTVAVPVMIEDRIPAALVLQSRTDGLLLVTNRALGQLLLTTLALMLGLTAGLWYFASRLSRRVERLSGAVSKAMDDGVPAVDLPLTGDGDELGELARNNALLLRAVSDYTQYLQTLAGKLSHELKTPLAITRSSLDNLASLPLDEDAQRFVERAREGLDRQGEIVRAMSEANRLEQSIRVAEWEQIDLGELVASMAEGYRAVHPGRDIATDLPKSAIRIRCAPDLLAQALDKLVDNAITLSGDNDTIGIAVKREGDGTRLVVRNTGSRLPDELQDRLFDSLVSLRSQRGDTPHLGLGLYIVRLVAEAHGGKVTARNTSDGVEFTIALHNTA